MPFIRIDGIEGKVFIPDEKTVFKKHPCKDCFFCQMCSDEKCSICLKKKICTKKDNSDNKKE